MIRSRMIVQIILLILALCKLTQTLSLSISSTSTQRSVSFALMIIKISLWLVSRISFQDPLSIRSCFCLSLFSLSLFEVFFLVFYPSAEKKLRMSHQYIFERLVRSAFRLGETVPPLMLLYILYSFPMGIQGQSEQRQGANQEYGTLRENPRSNY